MINGKHRSDMELVAQGAETLLLHYLAVFRLQAPLHVQQQTLKTAAVHQLLVWSTLLPW